MYFGFTMQKLLVFMLLFIALPVFGDSDSGKTTKYYSMTICTPQDPVNGIRSVEILEGFVQHANGLHSNGEAIVVVASRGEFGHESRYGVPSKIVVGYDSQENVIVSVHGESAPGDEIQMDLISDTKTVNGTIHFLKYGSPISLQCTIE